MKNTGRWFNSANHYEWENNPFAFHICYEENCQERGGKWWDKIKKIKTKFSWKMLQKQRHLLNFNLKNEISHKFYQFGLKDQHKICSSAYQVFIIQTTPRIIISFFFCACREVFVSAIQSDMFSYFPIDECWMPNDHKRKNLIEFSLGKSFSFHSISISICFGCFN